MYQYVVHRISLRHIAAMIEDCFGLRISFQEIHMLKSLVARRYRAASKQILARIVKGGFINVDETHANLKKIKGYVWVLTNLEDVQYMYRPNREAVFLQDLLKDFKGVLISDFYAGYDSLPCEQQKCLIHLIRDINDDLKRNPYDEEFKGMAAEFGKLLRSIVGTIDKYGLKKRHLHKHKAEVARFFCDLVPLAFTAPSWRTATRSGLPKTTASCSRSSTTTESHGTTILPSMRSRPLHSTVRTLMACWRKKGSPTTWSS